jgi:hypothetical protein
VTRDICSPTHIGTGSELGVKDATHEIALLPGVRRFGLVGVSPVQHVEEAIDHLCIAGASMAHEALVL